MKRVLIFLGSVLGLIFITSICLEFLGFYDIGFTITPNKPMWITLTTIFSISIGVPLVVLLILSLIRVIGGLFKPKFVRIAEELENSIKRNKLITHKLSIPQKKDLLARKMFHIWKKADMQYPLSEIEFFKITGGKSGA